MAGSERRKITPIEALRVVEVLAENASFERLKFIGSIVESDKVMDAIYRVAHAARSAVDSPDCGSGHDDWHDESIKAYSHMVACNDIAPESK